MNESSKGSTMRITASLKSALPAAALALAMAGCTDRTTIFNNPDPNLRLTASELRGDAFPRFPYKEDAPKLRETKVRAQVIYPLNRMELVNFSGAEWDDVEVWVNHKYVCYIPKMQDRQLKEVHFPMLFDERGNNFPMNSNKGQILVRNVEIFRDGKMYELTVEAS